MARETSAAAIAHRINPVIKSGLTQMTGCAEFSQQRVGGALAEALEAVCSGYAIGPVEDFASGTDNATSGVHDAPEHAADLCRMAAAAGLPCVFQVARKRDEPGMSLLEFLRRFDAAVATHTGLVGELVGPDQAAV
jgi:hypothetical protein